MFAALRLYGITNPPAEVAHSWRQTTVAMVARNFVEVDSNILYPRIDNNEGLSGITGMEFPLLNYLVYLVSLIFGYAHWYGRLINLIVTSIGCYYFYRIVQRFFNRRVALCSTVALLVSIWFAYGRKIMPDTFSMSLVLIGMYYGFDYLTAQRGRIGSLVVYVLFSVAGVLSKLPSGYALTLFALPFFSLGVPPLRKLFFALASALVCVPVAWWYLLWVPHLVQTFGLWHFFMGKGIAEGAYELWHNISDVLKHFYSHALGFVGFALMVWGIVVGVVRRHKLLLWIVAIGAAAFSLVMLKSGFTFAHHSYYVVPFVPVMALAAGYALASVKSSGWRVALLSAVVLEGVLNQHSDFIIRPYREPVVRLEQLFDSFSNTDDLIVVNSGEDPTALYFAHRKGWVASNDQLADTAYLHSLAEKRCRYVLVMKRTLGSDIQLPQPKIFDSEDYAVYRL